MTRPLSPGQCRVLEALYDEHSQFKDIARTFGVSVNTVKRHALDAYRKLGVNNRYSAAAKHRALRGHRCWHLALAAEREAAI